MGWIIDVVAVIWLIISAIICGKRGLIKSLCGVFGSVFGVVLAIWLAIYIGAPLSVMFGQEDKYWIFVAVIAVVLIIIILILLRLIGKGLTALVDKVGILRGLNIFTGIIFGIFYAVISIIIVVIVALEIITEVAQSQAALDFMTSGFIGNFIYNVLN